MAKKILGVLVCVVFCFQAGSTKAESVQSFSKTARFETVGVRYFSEYSLNLGFTFYNDPNGAIPGTWKEYFLLRNHNRILLITFTPIFGEESTVWINESFK